MNLNIYPDLETLSKATADLFVKQSQFAIQNKGRFSIALSGGSTPERTYELLTQKPWVDQVSWRNVHVFWGDERCVPPNDARHNALMAHKLLLSHVPIPISQIHPIICDENPYQTADGYEKLLHEYFKEQEICFDFMLLGIGTDGHTASLFPRTTVLHERKRWVSQVSVPSHEFHRVTLTIPILERSLLTVMLVEGKEKASALKMVLEGPRAPVVYPAQLISPLNGALIWMVDQAAAELLNPDNTCGNK